MTSKEFLQFFNDDEKLNQLSADDRLELFHYIMKDGSDITKELLNEIISDYSANIEIVDSPNAKTYDRDDFMSFLRDESKLDQLTREERTEVFRNALVGSSDFTKEVFEELFKKYGIEGLEVVEDDEPTPAYKVMVVYGEEQTNKTHNNIPLTEKERELYTKEYIFNTPQESEAFRKGLDEAAGWNDCYIK